MRNWITFLMTFLVGSASYVNATMGDVNAFLGYRHDKIEEKVRVPAHNPAYKQSTKFENLDIFQIGVNVKSTIGCNFYARAEATFGWVLDGEVKRSASLRNNFNDSYYNNFQTFDELKYRNAIDEKYVYDANIAIGYPFYFCECTAVVAPVIGYAVDVQNLNTHDSGFGFGSDSCGDYLNGGTNCCKRTFNHRWYGPFVGVDFNYRPFHDCWNMYAAFEYHWGTCNVKRTIIDGDFDHFKNHSHMDGYVINLGADYEMNETWTVGLYLKYSDFTASKHRRIGNFYSDSSYGSGPKAKVSTDWNSYAINVEFGRQF